MLRCKYIVVDNGLLEVIIVFPDILQHRDVAQSFGDVVSGGFITKEDEFICYGESISLGLKSRREDTDIANQQLGRLAEQSY